MVSVSNPNNKILSSDIINYNGGVSHREEAVDELCLLGLEDKILMNILEPSQHIRFEYIGNAAYGEFGHFSSESKEPLLWAMDRRYYYNGEVVAEVKGGNIYDDPDIGFIESRHSMNLEPIDLQKVIERNSELIFLFEQEAIEFIEHTYRTCRLKKIKLFYFRDGGIASIPVGLVMGGKDLDTLFVKGCQYIFVHLRIGVKHP